MKIQDMNLRYNFNAICALEQKAGMGLTKVLKEDNIGFTSIRLLLWAGVQHETKASLDTVGEWIQSDIESGSSIEEISNTITTALNNSGLLGKQIPGEK